MAIGARRSQPLPGWAYGVVFLVVLAGLVGAVHRGLPAGVHQGHHGHPGHRPHRRAVAAAVRREAARHPGRQVRSISTYNVPAQNGQPPTTRAKLKLALTPVPGQADPGRRDRTAVAQDPVRGTVCRPAGADQPVRSGRTTHQGRRHHRQRHGLDRDREGARRPLPGAARAAPGRPQGHPDRAGHRAAGTGQAARGQPGLAQRLPDQAQSQGARTHRRHRQAGPGCGALQRRRARICSAAWTTCRPRPRRSASDRRPCRSC